MMNHTNAGYLIFISKIRYAEGLAELTKAKHHEAKHHEAFEAKACQSLD